MPIKGLIRIGLLMLMAVLLMPLAEAQPGGLYEVNGRLVDADGNPVKRVKKAGSTKSDSDEEAALAEVARKQAEEAALANAKTKA